MNIKTIIASSAMILALANIASADPFSDLPTSHWAYEAVKSMAEKGIIQGFPDNTFKGNTNVTRYQIAMITAQALANIEEKKANVAGSDLDSLEKLTVEFADELSLLGVKITSLEDNMQVLKDDVSTLKKDLLNIKSNYNNGKFQKVKLTGDFLIRNYNAEMKNAPNTHFHRTGSQLRLQMDAQIDENVKAVARWRMIDDNNNDWGNPGALGAAWNGSNHVTGNVDVAYLEIKDMFRFHGDFVFGRRFMTHGHGLIINNFYDAISYIKRCGDIDLALNVIYDFDRQNNIDYHYLWNITADTKYRGHDLYLGLYYASLNQKAMNNIVTVAPYNEPAFAKNPKNYMLEIGSKGDLGNNGYWSYDIGGVYQHLDDGKVNAANQRKDKDGFILHGAINWDSKEEWAAKVAYTVVDEEANMGVDVSYDERYVDSSENPLEDIMRDSRYAVLGNNPLVSNIQDTKIQLEYIPKNNNKHYLRVAYDIVQPKDDSKNSFFFTAGNGNTDKADVFTAEYRYRLAENTRLRFGYTDFKFGSGNLKQDYNLFWSEILSRF